MNQYSDLPSELSDFLDHRCPYYRDLLNSEHLEFNVQLQNFLQRVHYIYGFKPMVLL